MPTSPNCPSARGPRDPRDLSEVTGGPQERFEARDADGPRPVSIPDDDEFNQMMLESIQKPQPGEKIDRGGVFASWTRFFRPTGNMLQDLERETGIPFWTWYRNIEIARREADAWLAEPSYSVIPAIFKGTDRPTREAVQELMELAGNAAGQAKLLKSLPPEKARHVQVMHDKLLGLYRTEFAKLGYSPDDIAELLSDFVPMIRSVRGDWSKFSPVKTPGKISKLVERMVKTGEAPLDRETDASVIAKTLFRAVSTETHLAPAWNHAISQFRAHADQMAPQTAELFLRYLHQVRHAPDTTQLALAESMRRIVAKLDGQRGFKKVTAVLNTSDLRDLTSLLVSWNYQANLAWNPGAVLRQFQQILQTVMPDMGLNDSLAGVKTAIRWVRDEKLQKYYEQRGVVSRNVQHEMFREVQDALKEFSGQGLKGRALEAFRFFQEKGTVAFKTADDFNRIVAYDAATRHITPYVKKFAKGEIGWIEFFERSKLDRLDDKEGPFTALIRGYLKDGKTEEAIHEAAYKFMQDTQFIYSRGNNPYVMNSTVGRFLGQYGTWPSQYAEYMRNMYKRGSQRNRISAFSRWLGINGAMVAGASTVLGVDVSKWSFFSPFGYQGGPFAEMLQQGMSVADLAAHGQIDVGKSWEKGAIMGTEDADLIDRLQAQRFGKNLYRQTIPVPWGQGQRTIDAVQLMWNSDVKEATKRFLGFPSTTPPQK